jgi:ABC-2 type transport system ATP-binding protein
MVAGSKSVVLAQLCDVFKRFGHTEALKGVTLTISPGEVVALLGPNGAGKTTALHILLGLRRPDRGEALLFGQDPRVPRARAEIGATPQEIGFPAHLSVREGLELVRSHYPRPLAISLLQEQFRLQELMLRQLGGLSGGQKRRVAVALAFVANPRVVFLDEPTTGLDIESRLELWTAIRGYVRDGGTVLLTTHYLDEVEALATRVIILDRGTVVIEGSVEAIRARVRLARVRFRAADVPPLAGVAQAEHQAETHTLYTADADALVRDLVRQGVALAGLEVRPATLEEAFLTLTRGAA